MGTISSFIKKIPVTTLEKESSVPLFRDFPPHRHIAINNNNDNPLTQSIIDTAGQNTAKRMLPYTEQNNYHAQPSEQEVLHICIENAYLKATILPEWGGRLISIYHKIEKRELLHNPQQIILRNLAIRNAWFAGGIEWNIGYYGHAVHSSSTVHCGTYTMPNSEQSLRIFDFDRMNKLWWQIDIILQEQSPLLEIVVTIYNDEPKDKNLYWWTNIAVPENKNTRVLCSNNNTLWRSNIKGGFQSVTFPFPQGSEIDYSYSTNYPQSSEFFFNAPKEGLPWIAAAEKNGTAFFEISSHALPYRKIFCWGQHQGGKNWQEFLHLGKAENYFEIQAGLAPTQIHYSHIAKKQKLQWVHCIGTVTLDNHITHNTDWNLSSAYVGKTISSLYKKHIQPEKVYHDYTTTQTTTTFSEGTWWGAMEKYDENSILPPWLLSQISTTKNRLHTTKNKTMARWHSLSQEKKWMPYNTDEQALWVIDETCQAILEQKEQDGLQDWGLYLHLGVLYREQYNFTKAKTSFKKSIALHPNQFAYWGLIELSHVYHDTNAFKYWITESLQYLHSFTLKKEIMQLCIRHKAWEELTLVLDSIAQNKQEDLRLLSIRIYREIYRENFHNALKLIQVYNPYLREGDIDFLSMWETIMKGLHGNKKNIPSLPPQLDYRMSISNKK